VANRWQGTLDKDFRYWTGVGFLCLCVVGYGQQVTAKQLEVLDRLFS
jgi:hypothetical protein